MGLAKQMHEWGYWYLIVIFKYIYFLKIYILIFYFIFDINTIKKIKNKY